MEYNTNEVAIQYPVKNQEIVKIFKSTAGKNGPYVSSKGNPFTKVDIYIDPRAIEDGEFQGKMSYFDYYGNTNGWEIGTSITGMVVKNGKYFNFQLPPSGKKAVELDIKEMKQDIEELQKKVFGEVRGHTPEVREAIDFSKKALDTTEQVGENRDIEEIEPDGEGLPF